MELLPKREALDRLHKIQAWMQDTAVDAVFVLQNADLYYFSGTVQIAILCLPATGEPLFLVQKSLTRARNESPWERLVELTSLKRVPDLLVSEGIGRLKRIGLEMDVLPVSYYVRIRDLFPAAEFTDASEAIRRVRMIKSEYEVGYTRRAAAMLQQGFHEIPRWMRPGVTELEIMARLEGRLRQLGHQGLTRMRGFNYEISYGTISIGSSASEPTFFPGPVGFTGLYAAVPAGGSERRLIPGDTLMADIVGGCGGYIADKTRVFVLGDPPQDMVEAQDFVLELTGEVESMLRPGTPCDQLWRLALDKVKRSPYAEGFMGLGDSRVRFLGHGVGLELNELPVLAERFSNPLEAGMIIAVEPKIFFAGRGGVGIENTYLITGDGFEKLTVFPEHLIRV